MFPWCSLDYLGLRLQCVCPLLWLIDPNYGIPWQPVCHFCVGSVPIAVLVILNFLWRFLFWFAVFSIASYLAVTQERLCTTFCFLYLCIFDILLLQIKYPPQPFSLTRVIIRTWVCKEALSFPNALDCVPKAFPYFCYPMPAVCNIDHWVIWLGLTLLLSWHHLTRLPPPYAMFEFSDGNALVAIGSDMPTSYATWDIRSVDLVSWCGGW